MSPVPQITVVSGYRGRASAQIMGKSWQLCRQNTSGVRVDSCAPSQVQKEIVEMTQRTVAHIADVPVLQVSVPISGSRQENSTGTVSALHRGAVHGWSQRSCGQ